MNLVLIVLPICSSHLLNLSMHSHKLLSLFFCTENSPSLTFQNSTSSIFQLYLVHFWNSIIMLDIESSLLVMNSRINGGWKGWDHRVVNTEVYPFICEGTLDLRSICLLYDRITSITFTKETDRIGIVPFPRVYLWGQE